MTGEGTNPGVDRGGDEGEPLFVVMEQSLVARTGQPLEAPKGRYLRIEITPTQMIRLTQELTPAAIQALMLVLEHGYVKGSRIEIDGWSGRWLREHGMQKYASEKAAAELRLKGYIRVEQKDGPLGKQLGIVPPTMVGDAVEDIPGVPRTDGRPRTGGKRQRADRHIRVLNDADTPASENPGNEAADVDAPVDRPVSRFAGNASAGNPGFRETENVFPQVSAVSGPARNGLSTGASSSSGSSEEGLFFLPGQGQALTRPDLTKFFAQPALTSAIAPNWEVVVALLARNFTPQTERCAAVIEWLSETGDAQPDVRLAQIVVDLVATSPLDRVNATGVLSTYLRSRGVNFRQSTPDDFVAAFVTTLMTAMDSGQPIRNWAGWFGAGLKRDEQFQGPVLAASLTVFARALSDPAALIASEPALAETAQRPSTGAGSTTYGVDDPHYVDRLRQAAHGTPWEDDTSFQTLLRNTGQQARLLAAYARRTQANGEA